jgi:hypothetical protein
MVLGGRSWTARKWMENGWVNKAIGFGVIEV